MGTVERFVGVEGGVASAILFTVTVTGGEVLVFPAASLATAVSV